MIAISLALAAAAAGSPDGGTCAADEARILVGVRYDDVVGNRRHGPRTFDPKEGARILARLKARGPVRWMMPGTSATMDWVPARTNIEVGDDGYVLKVHCG